MSVWRHYLVLAGFAALLCVLALRVGQLTISEREFLQQQGNSRSVRVEPTAAHRGGIYDRHGEVLALSTPVSAVWIDPSRCALTSIQSRALANALALDAVALEHRLAGAGQREFMYIKRRVPDREVAAVRALNIDGLQFRSEYKRYYPSAETTAHIVGQTGVDDVGLEGIELTFDDRLRGEAGAKRVLKDRRGQVVQELEYLRPARMGRDLELSIDLRLQYFAYRELKSAVAGQRARGASLVMLDARTGEVLALANQPSYNPNEPLTGDYAGKRNRAVTDTYEPGSTIKPFTMLAAIESGKFDPQSLIDTTPGFMRVGRKLIEDPADRGTLSLTAALKKSSQVAVAKLALALPERAVFDVLARAGIGEFIGTGLPGEASGYLSDEALDNPVNRATLAYGYGLAVSPLQLAQAYLSIAADGDRMPLTVLKLDKMAVHRRVFAPADTRAVLAMMETVTDSDGTAPKARVPHYRVAGKTGTARKLRNGRYDDDRHVALFAGIAPVSDPRLVIVVVVDEPGTKHGGGGDSAAPIFSRVAERSLRLLGVAPDAA